VAVCAVSSRITITQTPVALERERVSNFECVRFENAVDALENVLDKYGESMWEYQIEGLERAIQVVKDAHERYHE